MEIKNGLSGLFTVLLILSAALLLSATAVYAQPKATPAPCYNSVQDGNETGVDCGGRCFSPSMIELCNGRDDDSDCLVDEECKNWSSVNSTANGSAGVSGSGGSKPQGPPQGYQPFKIPQPNAGSTDPASSAEVTPQKAPEPEPPKSIPQDSAASGSPAVPAEQAPSEIPGQVGTAVKDGSIVPASSGGQKTNSPAQVNEKTGDAKAKSQQNKESQPSSQGKPNAFVRIARFFKGLFS